MHAAFIKSVTTAPDLNVEGFYCVFLSTGGIIWVADQPKAECVRERRLSDN